MKFLSLLLGVLLLTACAGEEKSQNTEQQAEERVVEDLTPPPNSKLTELTDSANRAVDPLVEESLEHHAAEHRIENPNELVRLNNGEKWQADVEMVAHVEVMEIILNDFAPEGLGDYHATAKVLDEELSALIASCTMKGEGHDELHNWLLPVMQKVEALGKAEDEEQAAALTASLKASLTDFHNYFEKAAA